MFSKEFKDAYFSELALPKANPNDKKDWPVKVTDTHEVSSKSLERAWETAHRIREFEIQLYWKRALYFWGFQAALFAVVASISSKPDSTELQTSAIPVILLLSITAMFLSIMWLLMSKGAKFWQNNWERQVDLLEEHICGNLYKVYPVMEAHSSAPFSVTRINMAVIIYIVSAWAFVAMASLYLLTKEIWPYLFEKLGSFQVLFFFMSISIIGVILAVLLISAVALLKSLKMGGFGDEVFPINSKWNKKESIYSRAKIESNP
jgi:hypothetical protein